MIKYLVSYQEIRDESKIHPGKLITAQENEVNIGRTGFLDYSGIYSSKTALLCIVGTVLDIEVKSDKRMNGVGKGLMYKLFGELKKDDFDELVIVGVLDDARGFYEHVLHELSDKNIIQSNYDWFGEYLCKLIKD